MNKKPFYGEQAEKFRDYASKFPDRDLLSLFDEWCESKDFSDEDRQNIFACYLAHFAGKKSFLAPRVSIHLKSDPILLRDIVNLILHAIELAENNETKKENVVDSKGKL